MKTFKGYINYGCLAAEKRPVFTEGNPQPTATVSEPVEYTVPEGWGCDETEIGHCIDSSNGVDLYSQRIAGGKRKSAASCNQ